MNRSIQLLNRADGYCVIEAPNIVLTFICFLWYRLMYCGLQRKLYNNTLFLFYRYLFWLLRMYKCYQVQLNLTPEDTGEAKLPFIPCYLIMTKLCFLIVHMFLMKSLCQTQKILSSTKDQVRISLDFHTL